MLVFKKFCDKLKIMNKQVKQTYLEKEATPTLLWLQIKALKQQIALMETALIPRLKPSGRKKSLYGVFKGVKFREKEIEEAKQWTNKLWQNLE